ncbi:uncharacterized protein LOC113675767 [Pocillopora damicornis]|uniref:uncharacterized protein LOC113675767 n=1 Tax=Pocillopora damicornis TaxID=46731 RepID=UPI000F554443|nr:uncharacterized protein LOC113675767 [Pocillopora damicornis]
MRIPFETLDPLYRSKTYRDRYQMLENAMGEARASVAVVTALMRQKLSAATDGEIDNYTDRLVEMADFQELVIDQRALVSYSLLVFVCKMILEKVGLQELFILVEEKKEKVVLPRYVEASRVTETSVRLPKEVSSDTDKALKNFFASITTFDVQNVAPFVNNRIKPTRCGCGEAVAFNVPCLARHIKVTGIDPVITDANIRHFITSKAIGCVGKSNKFWSRTTSSTSAHISRPALP